MPSEATFINNTSKANARLGSKRQNLGFLMMEADCENVIK